MKELKIYVIIVQFKYINNTAATFATKKEALEHINGLLHWGVDGSKITLTSSKLFL